MHMPQKAALLWSGGKDSALALHHARRQHPGLDVVTLVTCLSQAYDRVSMHGVRRRLIDDQADAVGLPVRFVVIPSPAHPSCPMAHSTPGTTFPPNDVYSAAMLAALAGLRADGVEAVVFGDIYLEDLRAYREKLLAHAGLAGRYPLWGRDPGELYEEFVALGFAAVTVCVDTTRLGERHLGRRLDAAFRDTLPAEVDPCGERGEYHSFAYGGPVFRHPVPFALGDVHRQPPFAFQELHPVGGTGAAAPNAPSESRREEGEKNRPASLMNPIR
jgi:uncharacterized protein (TIGR00290 family)